MLIRLEKFNLNCKTNKFRLAVCLLALLIRKHVSLFD